MSGRSILNPAQLCGLGKFLQSILHAWLPCRHADIGIQTLLSRERTFFQDINLYFRLLISLHASLVSLEIPFFLT